MRLAKAAALISALVRLANAQDPYGNVTNAVFSYEVTLPLPDYGSPCASQILVNQEFANSYGHPVFVDYSPPAGCPNFTHVTADLFLATEGFQYDRLMHLMKDGIEVWRPSTPEPVGRNVTSKESKDLSTFTNLFREPGLVQFSLDNILAGFNKGPYYTELRLNFYNGDQGDTLDNTDWFYDEPPTNFYPVVANQSTIYLTPAKGSIPQLARNTTRAVLNVFASGNSNEEFWYTNDLSQKGGTRLVKVFIDGTLAGFADPFPVVYTGGLDPALWQPLLGLKSTDVPSYVIDVSPFLPQLWNYSTQVEVAVGDGFNDTQGINSNWIIDASLLTWEAAGVAGHGYIVNATGNGGGWPIENAISAIYESEGAHYYQNVANSAHLDFVSTTSQAKVWSGQVSWSQFSEMTNHLNQSDTTLLVHQDGQGWAQSTWKSNGSAPRTFERSHFYPVDVGYIQLANGTLQLLYVNRSYDVNISNNGQSFWEDVVQESVYDDSKYTSIDDIYSENYHRHALAIDGNVVEDTNPPDPN